MIVVADVNTIWRRKPFEALAAFDDVLGLAPSAGRPAGRAFQLDGMGKGGFSARPVTLLPGWASRLAWLEQPRLWRTAVRACARRGGAPAAVVITSPHYRKFLNRVPGHVGTMYYASDNYREYAGWDRETTMRDERAIIERVDHTVFVSETLAERARNELPRFAGKISVSRNGTDASSLAVASDSKPGEVPVGHPPMPRPIVGVVGAINDRLDAELLLACARMKEIGTLLFVGGGEIPKSSSWDALRRHSKCVWIGTQPHHSIPAWMRALDVALIPYRQSSFNFYCSPMRLFDHLASGRPIVATTACPQVLEFQGVLAVGADPDEFRRCVKAALADSPIHEIRQRVNCAAENTWAVRAEGLAKLFALS